MDKSFKGKYEEEFSRKVGGKESRKLKARQKNQSIWFGLGTFGIIGWAVSIPTLLGVSLGIWIDMKWQSRFSWTLMLLCAGAVVGSLNAWYWVKREMRQDD